MPGVDQNHLQGVGLAQGVEVGSTRGALPVFPPVGLPEPPPAPAVPVSGQRALHKSRRGVAWPIIP